MGPTEFLAAVADPNLWKRVGLGALGVSLIILGMVFVFRQPITSIATTAVKAAT